jgi:hypothetical protein
MLLITLGAYGKGTTEKPSIAEAAKLTGTSTGTIKKAKRVKKKAVKAVKKAVLKGELTVNAADKIAKLPKSEQRKAAKGGAKSLKAKADSLKKPLPRGGLAADAIRAEREVEEEARHEAEARAHAKEIVTEAVNVKIHERLKATFEASLSELETMAAYTSGLTPKAVLKWALDIIEADRKAN